MTPKNTLKNILFRFKPIRYTWNKLQWYRTRYYLRFNPKVRLNAAYKSIFNKNIDWDNPTDLIEKIQWLQLYSDTSLWTICADKFLVREYVNEHGCADTLNTLYGKWDDVSQIDWSKLPESFVIKTNNSCGEIILVKNKNDLNIPLVTKKLQEWMNGSYGYTSSQLHYARINPCIIAEKLFVNKTEPTKSLIDYKIWCYHGVPEFVLVVYNRTKENYSLSAYDLEWNNISEKAFNKNNKHYSGVEISKPLSFDEMLQVSKKLSKDIAQVRVDFYDIDGKAIFGEMTFTTGYGYFSEEFYKYLGSKIDLGKVKKLPKPNTI